MDHPIVIAALIRFNLSNPLLEERQQMIDEDNHRINKTARAEQQRQQAFDALVPLGFIDKYLNGHEEWIYGIVSVLCAKIIFWTVFAYYQCKCCRRKCCASLRAKTADAETPEFDMTMNTPIIRTPLVPKQKKKRRIHRFSTSRKRAARAALLALDETDPSPTQPPSTPSAPPLPSPPPTPPPPRFAQRPSHTFLPAPCQVIQEQRITERIQPLCGTDLNAQPPAVHPLNHAAEEVELTSLSLGCVPKETPAHKEALRKAYENASTTPPLTETNLGITDSDFEIHERDEEEDEDKKWLWQQQQQQQQYQLQQQQQGGRLLLATEPDYRNCHARQQARPIIEHAGRSAYTHIRK